MKKTKMHKVLGRQDYRIVELVNINPYTKDRNNLTVLDFTGRPNYFRRGREQSQVEYLAKKIRF